MEHAQHLDVAGHAQTISAAVVKFTDAIPIAPSCFDTDVDELVLQIDDPILAIPATPIRNLVTAQLSERTSTELTRLRRLKNEASMLQRRASNAERLDKDYIPKPQAMLQHAMTMPIPKSVAPYRSVYMKTVDIPADCVCYTKYIMVLLASHMILISSHTDILHDPHVEQICTHSQHTSSGLTILNVLSSPKQLLPGMHSLKVWSLAPHWMHSRRHCHWGDRYQASVFEHTNLSCF